MFQQSAEPLLAADLVDAGNGWRLFIFISTDQPVANSLMWAALVVVGDELADDIIEVLEAKDNEVVDRFVFEALYPPFDERI